MGVSNIVTVTTAAPDYDLTDLATVKDELSIKTSDTSNDAWLGRGITQISKAIKKHCNRVFQVEAVTEVIYLDQDPYPYQTPGGVAPLQLARWPLVQVTSVVQTLSTASGSGSTQTLVQGTDYSVDADTGQLYRLNPFTGIQVPWEALPTTIVYIAGYGALASEPHTIPASGPFTVTVTEASAYSIDQGVSFTGGAAMTKVANSPAAGQYSVDNTTGIYTFAAADEGKAITIAYGYNEIPEDLVDATLRMMTQRYKSKDRDPMLMSKSQPNVGEQRFWVGGQPGQNGAFPPEIAGLLDGTYKVPTLV